MRPELLIIAAIFFGYALLELIFTGLFHKPGQRPKDAIVEVIGTVMLVAVTQPSIL